MVAATVLIAFFIAPATVFAQAINTVTHASDPDNSYWDSVLGAGSGGCSACHNLNSTAVEPGTSWIRKNTRTIADIKSFNDGVTPGKLGCTYCHNRLTASAKMKGVLDHFSGVDGNRTSQHPLGRTYTGAGAYQDTNGEYLSSLASNTVNEMDCLDCHDQALVAPYSVGEGIACNPDGQTPGADTAGCYMMHQVPPVNNPYMLKSVTLAGQYDNLCRTCHSATAGINWKGKGKDINVVSHAQGTTTGADPLKEADGTLLLTSDTGKDGTADALASQCTGCHSVHSSGNAKLFVSAYGNGAACTTCHLAGDRFNNYTTHGHGKDTAVYQQAGQTITLKRPCTACHFAMDVTTPNSVGSRKPHAEKSPAGGSIQEIYQKKFNLNISPLTGDAGADSGNPEWGICVGCHSLTKYKAHYSVNGVINGCQDCHDEHAEGSGSTSNIFMIPEKSIAGGTYTTGTHRNGSEDVVYTVPRYEPDGVTVHIDGTTVLGDFYRGDGKGFCDNLECHGAIGTLSTLMGTPASSNHTMKYQSVGSDCYDCHTHKDPAGGWRASASCDECHASSDPGLNTTEIPRTHLSAGESAATHTKHTISSLVGDCNICHLHDGKTVAPGTGTHMDGTIQFGGTKMPGMPSYLTTFGNTACLGTTNGCHDGDAGDWKLGLNNLDSNGCVDCHDAGSAGVVDAGKTLDQGGYPAPIKSSATKHTRHIANNAYVPGDCDDCHGANAAAGTHTGHKDGIVDTLPGLAYNGTSKTCTTSCHLANTANDWTNAQTLVCTDCHAGTYVGGGANAPASGLHAVAPRVTGNAHDDSWDADGADGAAAADCVTCHTTAPTNPSTAHINGTLDASVGLDDTALPEVHLNASVGFVDAVTPTCGPNGGGFTTCHGPGANNGDAGSWGRKWSTTAANTDGAECANCHGGSPTGAAPAVWTSWATGAGDLARPAGVGPGALTAAHDADWNNDTVATEISPNHGVCKNCHGMNSPTDAEPAYNLSQFWGAPGFHGNGSLDINGPSADENGQTAAGAEYNGNNDNVLEASDYSCTKACHQGAANLNHNMGTSGWPLKYGDFGAGNCNGCHGYPPLTATDLAARGGGEYVDAQVDTAYGGYAGGGDAHNVPEHLATNVVANNGWTPCLPCHDSTSHMTTTSILRANITGDVIFPAAYDDKAAPAATFTPGAGPTAATCANVSCHGGQTTPVWAGGTLDVNTCSLCHVAEAVVSQAAATQWNSAWSACTRGPAR